jgi:transposase/heme-degrading monooxygenase HmoA
MMVIRVIRAQVQPGQRLEYIQLCKCVTTLYMRMYPDYLEYRDCAAHEKTPEIVVSATLWQDEAAIQAFTQDHVNSGDWRAVAILPWEQEIVTRAEVFYFGDNYPSLMHMWNQLRTIVRQRRATTGLPPLNDEQWGKIEPILNPVLHRAPRGRPPRDPRPIYSAILDVIAMGSYWSSVPHGVAPATAWRRYKKWRAGDVWNEAWRLLLLELDPAGAQKLVLDFLDCSHHPKQRPPRKSATANT